VSQKIENVADQARRIYEEPLRALLEESHINEFVAIEPVSGEYSLGRTPSDVIGASRTEYPDRTGPIAAGPAAPGDALGCPAGTADSRGSRGARCAGGARARGPRGKPRPPAPGEPPRGLASGGGTWSSRIVCYGRVVRVPNGGQARPLHSPLTTHHSPLTTHHSPLATHHSPLTTHHSPLATRHFSTSLRRDPRPHLVGDESAHVSQCGHVAEQEQRPAPGVRLAADHGQRGGALGA